MHALYLASDGYCIQCMCILKLCVWLKLGRCTCIYRQFKVYDNYCQSHDKKESTARTHVHVHVYTFLCTLNISHCTYIGYKYGTTLQHTMFITPLIIIVPKLTAWHWHIVHSVLTDIVHPESLRMKRMCWACVLSAHAHASICNRSIALDRHLRDTGISDDVRPS